MDQSLPPPFEQDASFPSWSARPSKGKCNLRLERFCVSRRLHKSARVESNINDHQGGFGCAHTLLHNNVNKEENFPIWSGPSMPETPLQPMEFLSRSWSSSSMDVIQALSPNSREKHSSAAPAAVNLGGSEGIMEGVGTKAAFSPSHPTVNAPNHCISPIRELILQDRSPVIHKGGRTHNPVAQKNLDEEFSLTPRKMDELKEWLSMQQSMHPEMKLWHCLHKKWIARKLGCLRTFLEGISIRMWIKDLKEKRKEEVRLQKAQVHAAISVAGVAAAIAAFAAANVNDDCQHKINVAVASAAALVAAQCVEVAEVMGADNHQVSSVLNSAIAAKTAGDILTLTAAAATALRGATTLKSRLPEVARGLKIEIPCGVGIDSALENNTSCDTIDMDFSTSRQMLLKGTELLTRIQNGKPKWKMVSVFLNKQAQVVPLCTHLVGTQRS